MSGDSKTVAVFGSYGGDNLGNEATLDATLHGLNSRLPDARIVLVSEPPPEVAGLNGFHAVIPRDPMPLSLPFWHALPWRVQATARKPLMLLSQPLRRMRMRRKALDLDLLLVAGTGVADDFYQDPLDVPLHLSSWCAVANEAGVPVRFASVGAGPVESADSIYWFRRALQAADFRSYRDAASKGFACSIGVDGAGDQVLPDLAFSLPTQGSEYRTSEAWPPRTIGLGVMGYFGWNANRTEGERIYAEYVRKLIALVEALVGRGFQIRLLVGHRRDDNRPVADVLGALKGRTSFRDGALAAPAIATYKDVLREMAATDLVIATRFHNVLFALLLHRPVISLEYGKKNTALMAEMAMERYCHFIETFDPDKVLRQVDELAALERPPVDTIRQRVSEYRRTLDTQFDALTRLGPGR